MASSIKVVVYPVQPTKITQGFGERPEVYKQFGLAGHNGQDYRTKYSDSATGERDIQASWDCTFFRKGDEGKNGYGRWLEVVYRLKRTWKVTYAHCKEVRTFLVASAGQTIAISDNTGFSTGAHLHITTKPGRLEQGKWVDDNPNNGYKGAVNPVLFFDEVAIMNPVPDLSDDEKRALDVLKRFKDTETDLKAGNLEGAVSAAIGSHKDYPGQKKRADDLVGVIFDLNNEKNKWQSKVETLEKQQGELSQLLDCANNFPEIRAEIKGLIEIEDQQNELKANPFGDFLKALLNLVKIKRG